MEHEGSLPCSHNRLWSLSWAIWIQHACVLLLEDTFNPLTNRPNFRLESTWSPSSPLLAGGLWTGQTQHFLSVGETVPLLFVKKHGAELSWVTLQLTISQSFSPSWLLAPLWFLTRF